MCTTTKWNLGWESILTLKSDQNKDHSFYYSIINSPTSLTCGEMEVYSFTQGRTGSKWQSWLQSLCFKPHSSFYPAWITAKSLLSGLLAFHFPSCNPSSKYKIVATNIWGSNFPSIHGFSLLHRDYTGPTCIAKLNSNNTSTMKVSTHFQELFALYFHKIIYTVLLQLSAIFVHTFISPNKLCASSTVLDTKRGKKPDEWKKAT